MNEPPLDLSGHALSRQKEMVRVFYKEMWDHADVSLVPRIFHPDFTFRGSLGPQLIGHQQFIGYVEFVTGALEHYTSDILALVEEGNQVFGKLRFHGYHRGELFGIPPSGRHVWWYGTPIFTFDGKLVRDLWVLGDIYGLIGRLRGESSTP
jgi:predicted ester cyclase